MTGEIVYVNFGIPADYETLQKLGIDVKGKIVLARYGGSWRGIKPKVAAEHGAIACIIYSDPHEDGYFQGEVYPDGPFRGWGMIQRGSVMDMPRYPGDPSTPGRPSKPGVERLPMDKIETFAPIPVQPMSYRDGVELLKRLKGPVAPEAWRGALPLTYHIGPGPAKVHMNLQMDYAQRRLINVVGTITGAVAPDEWIIVGSHRDAWTFGASDSVSGHVSMMSVARAMGEMMKKGWRPRRSVLFVSWDGEEQGLLGSTEWVEDLATELKAKAAVYVNRDAGAGGLNFSGSAVHSLTPFLHELAQSIQPEGASKTLYDGWLERAREQAPARDGQPMLETPPVGALGSGSDYTAFLDHVGIASMDMGLSGRGGDGSYHSTYDNPTWFKKYIDPQFKFSVLAAQVTGVALLRLADAEVLPFDYESYGRQILEYVDEIEQQATKASAADAKKVDFAGLKAAAEAFATAGARRARARRVAADALGRRRTAGAGAGGDQPSADHGGARSDRAGRPAGSAVVPPRDLRARSVHRLRREDDSRRARSGRRRQLHARRGAGDDRHPRAAARDEDLMAIDGQGDRARDSADLHRRLLHLRRHRQDSLVHRHVDARRPVRATGRRRRRRRRCSHWYLERVAIPGVRSSRGWCRSARSCRASRWWRVSGRRSSRSSRSSWR